MRHLTLEEKVGQLMIFGFPDQDVPEYIQDFILHHNLGGIIHFSHNIANRAQIKALNAKLQDLAHKSASAMDLLITVDQEGGRVARLFTDVKVSPGNRALGAAANLEWSGTVAELMGEELRAHGFNVNLAPCVDVNNNPQNPVIGTRSFGPETKLVCDFGEAAIRGLQKHVMAVAKHFPGHGDTNVDSHLSMPVIEHDLERLKRIELPPFKRAIQCGVGGILAAHVLFPSLEKQELPASLSPSIVTKLLREQLGFQGLIFTDCMEMGAITEQYAMGEAVVLAVVAGCDLVFVSHTKERQEEAYWAVVEAVKNGRISMERLDQSVERIRLAKQRLEGYKTNPLCLGEQTYPRLIEEIVKNSRTVIQSQETFPALVVVEPEAQAASNASLALALSQGGCQVEALTMDLNCVLEERQRLLNLVASRSTVVIAVQDAHLHPGQILLIEELANVVQKVIAVGPVQLG